MMMKGMAQASDGEPWPVDARAVLMCVKKDKAYGEHRVEGIWGMGTCIWQVL